MATPTRLLGKAVNRTEEVNWELVYADLLPRVYNYFRYRVRERATAEDLTATTFERAWRQRKRYRRDLASFSTWVFGIARNITLGYYRQHHDTIALGDIEHQTGHLSVEDSVEKQSDVERLSSLIKRLPTREQELLALKYGAELTNREIARVTGLSESNVGTILSRVVENLRAQWESRP